MSDFVFHPGLKLSWLESIARDRSATDFDVRVAVAISNRTQNDGVARTASQQWIARYIGATERGVRKSINHIREIGYIELTRNALGAGADGRPAFGGNGHATEYKLVKTQTRKEGTRNGDAVNPEQRNRKPGMTVPILSYSSNKDSLAQAGAHASDPNISGWLVVRKRLAEEVGSDVFDAWFAKARLVHIRDGTVTLCLPTKFLRTYLENNYQDRTLRAWQAHDETIKAVRFDCLAERNLDAPRQLQR